MAYYDPNNMNQRRLLAQYAFAQARIQRAGESQQRAPADVHKFVNDVQSWANANFSPRDLQQINSMVESSMHAGFQMVDQQAQQRQNQQNQQAYNAEQYDSEVRNRALTKDIIKGGLTSTETAELRTNGSVTRQGVKGMTRKELNASVMQETRGLTKSGKGMTYKRYVEMMDSVGPVTAGSKEWQKKLNTHGIKDSQAFRDEARNWNHNGLAEVNNTRLAMQDTPEHTVELDDHMERSLDIRAAMVDDNEEDTLTAITDFDPDWVESGSEGENSDTWRPELAAAWEQHQGSEAEFSDVSEAMGG